MQALDDPLVVVGVPKQLWSTERVLAALGMIPPDSIRLAAAKIMSELEIGYIDSVRGVDGCGVGGGCSGGGGAGWGGSGDSADEGPGRHLPGFPQRLTFPASGRGGAGWGGGGRGYGRSRSARDTGKDVDHYYYYDDGADVVGDDSCSNCGDADISGDCDDIGGDNAAKRVGGRSRSRSARDTDKDVKHYDDDDDGADVVVSCSNCGEFTHGPRHCPLVCATGEHVCVYGSVVFVTLRRTRGVL